MIYAASRLQTNFKPKQQLVTLQNLLKLILISLFLEKKNVIIKNQKRKKQKLGALRSG